MLINRIRNKLILKTIILMFAISSIATIVRPILIDQSWLLTMIGTINSLMLGSLWLYLRKREILSWHAKLVIIVGFISVTPLLIITGGVNSQFAALLPAIPVFVCLIVGIRASWAATLFITCLVVVMALFIDYFPDITNTPENIAKTHSRAFWLTLSCILSSTFAAFFYSINQKLSDKLHTQAFEDGLTKIANRRSIVELLESVIVSTVDTEKPFSLILVDVDNFKALNDNHGHLVGDLCLELIAKVLKDNIRSETDVVGRYGGEEFLIILRNTNAPCALKVAENLRDKIAATAIKVSNELTLNVTCTFGVTTDENDINCPQNKTSSILIKEADDALYKGKKSGRNCVITS